MWKTVLLRENMNNTLLNRLYSSSTSNSIKWNSKLIRNEFLNYFKDNLEHTFIRSSPVTPLNDSSISFVNAGMNQFKGIFLNYYDPPAKKVTNSQKCIRISGKHNDLSIVGNDSYHHTFFEMLGNWSFSDYFKEEACLYAWNLLTKHYGIKENSLYVTYFGGNEQLRLEPDLECRDIWLNIGVAKDKVLPFDIQDNFWEMGVSGPCGPCTEIHIDHKNHSSNQSMRVNKGYSDLTELWNIVFIQYERLADDTMIPLPKYHVDTGMGFERLVALLQGKNSNYDTDLFQPLIKATEKYTKAPGYRGRFFDDDNNLDSSYRILADHSRMITVALADGMVPEENHKLRKIIRKVIDTGEKVFKKEKILSELSYAVADTLGDVYPELQTNLKKVQKIMEFEEDLFKRLRKKSGKEWRKIVENRPELASVTDWMAPGLLNAYKYLQSIVEDLKASKTLPGDVAFKLFDTYGLNEETIAEFAEIESLQFDKEDFQNVLQNVKYQSKIGNLILNNKDDAVSKGITLNKGDEIGIILDKTLCYSVEGGQTSDHATIFINDLIFHINNVQKRNAYVIHFGKLADVDCKDLNKEIKIGGNCMVSIDPDRRKGLMQHHTAAHLLNAAMKQTLHAVYQRSSLVLPHSLKFQFNSFGEKLSLEQLKQIEKSINNVIEANVFVKLKVFNSSELLTENFVTLIPGEIYPYTDIRVVDIDTPDLKSKEACCGTHVHRTGILEHFCLLNYHSKGSANFTVKGAAGQLAESAKTAGKNIQQKVLNLRDKLNHGKLEYETFKSISEEIKNEINDVKEEMLIPYLVKMECLKQIEDLNNDAWVQAKEVEKSDIILKVKDTDPGSFIVHCLYNNPTYLSLQEIMSSFSNTPVFIIICHNGTIKARCSVPQEIACNTFNAQTWMKIVLEIFNAEYVPIKGFNPSLVASMKSTNVSNLPSENLLCNAINAAKDFASRNVKRV
ncbi:alanine--tRNA ligase, mitochondrial isoform X2 [Lasioglossum baleicum]|uniref:alanine--tRNA ligase, mitochondrial isoform X2 n=1 Tax=Lasioglossum baleicum TaxID=434251 RepID=UPI003FCD735E